MDQQAQQPQPQQPYGYAQQPYNQPYMPQPPGFWDRPATMLTNNDLRRVIRNGVAEGVLLAGIVLVFFSILISLACGELLKTN